MYCFLPDLSASTSADLAALSAVCFCTPTRAGLSLLPGPVDSFFFVIWTERVKSLDGAERSLGLYCNACFGWSRNGR